MKVRGQSSAPAEEGTEVSVATDEVKLDGTLMIPHAAIGLVIFAHGSGSSRFSPRNQFVARTLNRAHLATLLFDLLTPLEYERDAITTEYRFDISLLAQRLTAVIEWAAQERETRTLSIGLFGASTGAAAALTAAAQRPEVVKAAVSRGGRPDLAGDALAQVHAPTLLIAGARDREVIALNRQAAARLTAAECQLVIVPDATHLFEEPGTLEEVAFLAADWFERHLGGRPLLPGYRRSRLRLIR